MLRATEEEEDSDMEVEKDIIDLIALDNMTKHSDAPLMLLDNIINIKRAEKVMEKEIHNIFA